MRTELRSGAARAGFTAIELLVVLVVILILIGMAVPALVGAMRKGAVNDAANAIVRVNSQARQFSRTRMLDAAGRYYGIIIGVPSDGKGAYAALTYGTNPQPTESDIATTPPFQYSSGGKPISFLRFNRNVVVYTAGTPTNLPTMTALAQGAHIGWLYQYRTGYPIVTASATAPAVNIGVDPEWPTAAPASVDRTLFPPTLRNLTLSTADGKYRTAVAIYQIGLSNVQDF